jgi:hypothetical protein
MSHLEIFVPYNNVGKKIWNAVFWNLDAKKLSMLWTANALEILLTLFLMSTAVKFVDSFCHATRGFGMFLKVGKIFLFLSLKFAKLAKIPFWWNSTPHRLLSKTVLVMGKKNNAWKALALFF